MMHIWRSWWIACAIATLIAVQPAHAASYGAAKGADAATVSLVLPAADVPPGFVPQPQRSFAISRAAMRGMLGNFVSQAFLKSGWTAGYHGWLDATSQQGNMFVTYDLYRFKTAASAQADQTLFQSLVSGVETPLVDARLPGNAMVYIDQTGTYGQDKPFVVVEVVFSSGSVLADIAGYFGGGDAAAANADASSTIAATSSVVSWLARLPQPAVQR
jgi:hypothetical protein